MRAEIKLIILLFAVLFTAVDSFAQKKINTGYMGKKVYISYTSKAFPSTVALRASSKGYNQISYAHCIDFNFIYKWRKTLSISGIYEKSKIQNPASIKYYDYDAASQMYMNNPSTYYTFYNLKKSLNINTFGGAAGLKFQNRHKHAPVGPYIKWSIIYLTQSVKLSDYDYTYKTTTSISITEHRNETIKFKSAGGEFSFGNQRVFYDKIVFSYGMGVSIIVNYSATPNSAYKTQYGEDVLNNMSNMIPGANFLRAHVSIGFLAF